MSRHRRRAAARAVLALLALVLLAGCGPKRAEVRRAVVLAQARADTAVDCLGIDACAIQSPLLALAEADLAASREGPPRHHLMLLDAGQDALLARIHVIRAARERIDVQSYIYAQDDAGWFVLQELLAAARRGVRVRLLLDQLFSLDDAALVAALAQQHVNFELRLYNPTFGRARTNAVQFVAGALCCFTHINQRMHNKLLLVDGKVGITGGRNYQNRYFDWDPEYNYRDRDVLVTGPATAQMQASFDAFWSHRESVAAARLKDVVPQLLDGDPQLPAAALTRGHRILEVSAQADTAALVRQRLVDPALAAAEVEYWSDPPGKGGGELGPTRRELSARMRALLADADERILLQTPYLVLSRPARRLFRELQRRPDPPRVVVSTNSLAATDAFPVYALSHKYKRTYLREFGFDIYEYKAFPGDAPIDVSTTGADEPGLPGENRPEFGFVLGSRSGSGPGVGSRGSGAFEHGRVPLEQAGVRIGLHAKSLVIDGAIGLVGTHNFDPRSDIYNTESTLIVRDPGFAGALASSVLRDTLPANAWPIAPRPKLPLLSGLNYSLGKLFEQLPLFDFWPWRYATSWEFIGGPDCTPVPRDHALFGDCYRPVGDFPGVALELKSIYTRILTAFGAGLAPIL